MTVEGFSEMGTLRFRRWLPHAALSRLRLLLFPSHPCLPVALVEVLLVSRIFLAKGAYIGCDGKLWRWVDDGC